MKKIFHLGMLALCVAFITTSCSKSKDSLAPGTHMAKAKDAGEIAISPSPGLESKFCPFISEPVVMELGTPNSVLYENDQATFYIILSDENSVPVMSTLFMEDAVTGQAIQSFDFLHYTDPAAANLVVPDDVVGHPFMFATVNLDNQYVNRTISLHNFLYLASGESKNVYVENAFIVNP